MLCNENYEPACKAVKELENCEDNKIAETMADDENH